MNSQNNILSTVKEVREFFLRGTTSSFGVKRDREVNFPTTSIVRGQERGNRFLENHIPTIGIFSKLFYSIPFKLNSEDKATTTQQGLVKVADDTKAATRVETDSDSMQPVLTPRHMPVITTSALIGDDAIYNLDVAESVIDVSQTIKRLAINVKLKTTLITYLKGLVTNRTPLVVTGSGFTIEQGDNLDTIIVPVGTSSKTIYLPRTDTHGRKLTVKVVHLQTFLNFATAGGISIQSDALIESSPNPYLICTKDSTDLHEKCVVLQYLEVDSEQAGWFVISEQTSSFSLSENET